MSVTDYAPTSRSGEAANRVGDPAHSAARPAIYTAPSATLSANHRRIRELARAMIRLDAEGECTRPLLLQEGFSAHELDLHGRAARRMAHEAASDPAAMRKLVEDAAAAPLLTDEQLLDKAHDRVGGLVNEGQIVAALRGIHFTHDTIARIWPRLMARLAREVALTPIPTVAA